MLLKIQERRMYFANRHVSSIALSTITYLQRQLGKVCALPSPRWMKVSMSRISIPTEETDDNTDEIVNNNLESDTVSIIEKEVTRRRVREELHTHSRKKLIPQMRPMRREVTPDSIEHPSKDQSASNLYGQFKGVRQSTVNIRIDAWYEYSISLRVQSSFR